jgi:two-component sensor histidine kinase
MIAGDNVSIDDRGATPIGLLIHELATNASKYGALSVPNGTVKLVASIEGDELVLSWQEAGGPRIHGPPDRIGFGTKLTELSIVQQLGGSLERNWKPEGLAVEVRVLLSRLAR